MDDERIAAEIQRRGLEEEYLRELVASLGFTPAEGFSNPVLEALEAAPLEQRRRAALRTLELARAEEERGGGSA